MVPNLAHRSDAGLVSRKIADAAELESEFVALAAKAKSLSAGPLSISVEKFVDHDLEIILGVKYDATFGPVVLCGLGGIFTEVLKDYALRLAPLSKSDAEEMLVVAQSYAVLKKIAEPCRLAQSMRCSACPISPSNLTARFKAVDINPIALGGDAVRRDRARRQGPF